MKRLLFGILALMLLTGCAAIKEDRPMTVEEKQEIVADILLFTGETAINYLLWDSGNPDLSGQRPPDWWKDLGE